jgi:hypothetical protein
MTSVCSRLHSKSVDETTLTSRRHPWHLNERVVFLLLGTSLFGIREAYSEIAFDRLKPVWPAKKVGHFAACRLMLIVGSFRKSSMDHLVYAAGDFTRHFHRD